MTKEQIIELFAEEQHMALEEARASATPYELFNSWLTYEGIIGYTDKILAVLHECFQKE